MEIVRLCDSINFKDYLKAINCDSGGISILQDKMKLYYFHIKDLNVVGANILKQEALSIGADVATPRECIVHGKSRVEVILIIDKKRLKTLIKKLLKQPFSLKELAQKLKDFLYERYYEPLLMGVLNINDDSFFSGSRTNTKDAIGKIYRQIEDGANIVDIGAVTSKPNSVYIGEDEEFDRVKSLIDSIYKDKIYENIDLSIDTFSTKVASYALNRGFSIINDITGLKNDDMCTLIASFKAKAVLMHMQNTPINMQNNPVYDDVITDIMSFFKQRIAKAREFGVENIILDPGIGFGKTLDHNLKILACLRNFKIFALEILIGVSRKSLIDKIYPSLPEDRLSATLVLNMKAYENGANILRVHDVAEHAQAIKVLNRLLKTTYM